MAKTGLVVSAHPGDFVWRAGGAIALHARRGYRVKIVCLAFGERGESQFAWKQPGMTLEKVKAGRKDEAERAAAALGAEIEFFDAGDYPLRLTGAHMDRLIMTFLREYAETVDQNDPAKKHTVVVVTHATEHLTKAHQILVVVEDGQPAYCGPPKQIRKHFGFKTYADLMSMLMEQPREWADKYHAGSSFKEEIGRAHV